MTDTLHQVAQADTPEAVNVPKDMTGLIYWAIGRFGSGIVIAAACAFALNRVYEDHSKQTGQLMTILESRAKIDAEMTVTMNQLRAAIDEVAREARNAHHTTQP